MVLYQTARKRAPAILQLFPDSCLVVCCGALAEHQCSSLFTGSLDVSLVTNQNRSDFATEQLLDSAYCGTLAVITHG